MSQYDWNPDDEEQTPLEELQDYYPHVYIKEEVFDDEWMDLMDEWEEMSNDEMVERMYRKSIKKAKKDADFGNGN